MECATFSVVGNLSINAYCVKKIVFFNHFQQTHENRTFNNWINVWNVKTFSVVGNLCINVHCVKKLFSLTISSKAQQNRTCNTIQVVHELYLSMYIVWTKLFSWTISSKAQQTAHATRYKLSMNFLWQNIWNNQVCIHEIYSGEIYSGEIYSGDVFLRQLNFLTISL